MPHPVKILCPLLAVVLLALPGASARPAGDPLDDLFARARAARDSVRTLTASFTETTVSTLLREPLVASGTLVVALPLRVVMTYTAPVAKTVALDESRLVVVGPGPHDRETIDIAAVQSRVNKYFRDASPEALRRTFTITLAPDPGGRNPYRLDLVPKRKQVAEGVSHLRLWIDRTRLLLVRMTLDYPSGDSKTFDLHDVRTNVPLVDDAFAVLRQD